MDVFTNTKKSKKIFIILVILILFNFAYPKNVKAASIVNSGLIIIEEAFFGLFHAIQDLIDKFFIDSDLRSSNITSAETIIKGKFLLMEPNIFKKVTSAGDFLDYNKVILGRDNLRNTILGWYYALRNLAIIALLSILVYVAIRMILTTVSQDKAKYKAMFKDWLVALCLLFFMHYIMVGILNLSSTITEVIGSTGQSTSIEKVVNNINDYLEEAIELNAESSTFKDSDVDKQIRDDVKSAMAMTVIYAAMVIMNGLFAAKYIIRSLTIIFLTLLAPVTCITYPIDKISDGKAQAYDMWFKEFLYQVIIQPFHLLLYIILIGSSAELASENLIYAMLCFGVMIPAEKFVKQMFGFKDKLGSPLGDLAPVAATQSLMRSIGSGGRHGGDHGGRNHDKTKEDELPPNTKDPELPDGIGDGDDERDNSRRENSGGGNSGGGNSGGDNSGGGDSGGGNSGGDDSGEGDSGGGNSGEGDSGEGDSEEGDSGEGDSGGGNSGGGNSGGGNSGGGNSGEGDSGEGDSGEGNSGEGDSGEGDSGEGDSGEGDSGGGDSGGGNSGGGNSGGGNSGGNDSGEDNQNQRRALYTPNSKTTRMARRMLSGAGNIAKKTGNVVRAKTGRRFMRKYGSTSAKKIAGRMAMNAGKKVLGTAYRTGKNVGRRAIRGAVTLAGGLAFGAFGAMFGKGKEAMAIGTQFGDMVGNGLTNITDKVWDEVEGGAQSVKDTASEVYNEFGDHKNEKNKKEHHMNERNIKQARSNFYDRYGKEATPAELQKELDNMYMMKQHGVDDSNYNAVLEQSEKYQEEEGMPESDAMKTAIASAKEAQTYSAKDFRDEKTMIAAKDGLMRGYQDRIDSGEITQEQAEENVERILSGAAQMKGVKKSPIASQLGKEKYMANRENKAKHINTYAQRHGGREPSKQQLNHELELGYKLKRARTR